MTLSDRWRQELKLFPSSVLRCWAHSVRLVYPCRTRLEPLYADQLCLLHATGVQVREPHLLSRVMHSDGECVSQGPEEIFRHTATSSNLSSYASRRRHGRTGIRSQDWAAVIPVAGSRLLSWIHSNRSPRTTSRKIWTDLYSFFTTVLRTQMGDCIWVILTVSCRL